MREYAKKLLKMLRSPALGKIWQSMAGERKRILLLSALDMLSALFSLSFTLIMKTLVDSAVSGERQRLLISVLVFIGLIVVMLALGYIRRIIELKAHSNLLRSMREEAVHRLLHKQYGAMQAYHSGELVNRIFSDAGVVAGGVLDILPPMLFLMVQLVGASVILYRLNAGFMLILLTTGLLSALASFGFRHKMKAFHKDTQRAEDHFHARIQETLGNLRIIKASGIEERMERENKDSQQLLYSAQLRRGRFSALMSTGMGVIFRGSWLYALLWGCMGVYHGTLTYGTLTAILQLVGQIQSPFEGLISTLGTAFGTVSSAERLMELYELPDDLPRQQAKKPDHFQTIRMENVHFSYSRGEHVLKGVNFALDEGEVVAIMGPSGCGKSTMFLLLLGIYQPTEGRIQIELRDRTVEGTIRELFAYVPQGNALFSGTLRENIAMFCQTAPTEEQIWQAAEQACIDDFIRAQEQGLDTLIGERGIGLSEGQAQRIAIARALLTDCPVLLLDEATSALDERTEALLLQNIARLKNKTCLIVTHRKAALDICTRRIELRAGMTEEIGLNEHD